MSTDPTVEWWIKNAKNYLELAIEALSRNSLCICLHLVQHAAEFCFKAMIRQCSGDHPYIRNPYTLLHIGALYIPGLRKVFPRQTTEEIRLFSYLNPYRFAAQKEMDMPAAFELKILAERVQLLLEIAGKLQ
jgi:HEPN domain-containing protein